MKRKILSLVLTLALCLGLVPAALAADAQPVESKNKNAQDYTTYGPTVKSYLYENSSGGLTRVEYAGKQVVVEDYDSSFRLQSSRIIAPELSLWGGFYAGEQFNFLIYGQPNRSESNSVEVIRVVKYDKDWNRLGQTSVRGANTTVPFDAGSLRCAEYGGYLYIRTCHEMYRSDDGINHQSNLTLQIKESDMTQADSYDDIWCIDWGYISHSFNQFILIDQDQNIVALDQSDSDSLTMGAGWNVQNVKARGAILVRYDQLSGGKAGSSGFTNPRAQKWCSFSLVQGFAGSDGVNTTGASLGGFAETSSGYVSAYNYDGVARSGDRNVYLGYTSKSGLRSSASVLSAAPGTSTPILVPTGLSGGYVMWNGKSGYTVSDTLYYASYDANGRAGQVRTAAASLSDCQPIQYNGKLVWYVTDSSAPVFYTLDASGVQRFPTVEETEEPDPVASKEPDPVVSKDPDPVVSKDPDPVVSKEPDPVPSQDPGPAVFPDVPSYHWAYSYVQACAGKGIVKGKEDGNFDPEGTVTRAEFCTMLARAFFPNELAGWERQAGGRIWYWAPMSAVYNGGKGLKPTVDSAASYQKGWTDGADVNLSRYEMARIMYELLPRSSADSAAYYSNASAKLTDWSRLTQSYRWPVAVCVYHGIITGTDGGRFAGDESMSRAQACAVLTRLESAGASAAAIQETAPDPAPSPEPSPSPSPEPTPSPEPSPSVTPDPEPVSSGALQPGTVIVGSQVVVLNSGSELLLTAYVVREDGGLGDASDKVTWTNDSPDLISFRKSGSSTVAVMRGTPGTATVTGTCEGQTIRQTIRIVNRADRIHVTNPFRGLRVGESASTSMMLLDGSRFIGQDYTVSWSVDDPEVVEISASGSGVRYTAKAAGRACITCRVTLPDGTWAEDYCHVYVY